MKVNFDKIMILKTDNDDKFMIISFKLVGMKIDGDRFFFPFSSGVPVDARLFYSPTERENAFKIYALVMSTTDEIQEVDATYLTKTEMRDILNVGL